MEERKQKCTAVRLAQIEQVRAAYERALAGGDPSEIRRARLTLYLHHGWPLGGRARALEIWEQYGTGVTRN